MDSRIFQNSDNTREQEYKTDQIEPNLIQPIRKSLLFTLQIWILFLFPKRSCCSLRKIHQFKFGHKTLQDKQQGQHSQSQVIIMVTLPKIGKE